MPGTRSVIRRCAGRSARVYLASLGTPLHDEGHAGTGSLLRHLPHHPQNRPGHVTRPGEGVEIGKAQARVAARKTEVWTRIMV